MYKAPSQLPHNGYLMTVVWKGLFGPLRRPDTMWTESPRRDCKRDA